MNQRYQVRIITYDIILMQLGIGQEIFPIIHYQLPITGLHRYDKSLNGHDMSGDHSSCRRSLTNQPTDS
ncbi:hypothetical protein [Fischerella thermalis]|uniref:hypothetical protein n=1 Tax=Fischerella thermalis TaxID=372787 RepID=UPI00307D2428